MFTTLDLGSTFLQQRLDPETKHKTAFNTHNGHYQFTRSPFGLMSSPAKFQKLLVHVLSDLNFRATLCYCDDILVMSAKDFKLHLKYLKMAFDRLESHNLTLKPSKAQFCAKTVTYLGFKISQHGVTPDPSKIAPIANQKPPSNLKSLRTGYQTYINYSTSPNIPKFELSILVEY